MFSMNNLYRVYLVSNLISINVNETRGYMYSIRICSDLIRVMEHCSCYQEK